MEKDKMDFNEYQEKASQTAIYPNKNSITGLMYCTLGMCGEAGEVSERVKKLYRDHDGAISEDMKKDIIKELGDVLWYLSGIAKELNISLDEIATTNIEKLFSRKERDMLHGEGDNR